MKMLFFGVLFIFFYGKLSAQDVVKGKVIDKDSKEIIPFAFIGVSHKNYWVMSNAEGLYTLNLDSLNKEKDSLAISCMGYRKSKISLDDFIKTGPDLYLKPEHMELSEIVVSGGKRKEVKIGFSGTGTGMLCTPLFSKHELKDSSSLGREVGTMLEIKEDCSIRSLHFFITNNRYPDIKLRLLFYNIKDDLPDELMINRDIIFEIKDKGKGWQTVDLKPYKIRFNKGQQVAVTFMSLDESDRRELWVNMSKFSSRGILRRNRILGDWERIGGTISLYLDGVYYK